MATITQLLTSVENLFTTTEWTSHNIKAFPANYQGKISADEWIRVSVLPFSSELIFNQDVSVNGQVVCQWKCGYGQDQHHATTSGYGTCPTKY